MTRQTNAHLCKLFTPWLKMVVRPMICFLFYTLDHERDLLNLALVQYTFDGAEHQVLPHPHGNMTCSETIQGYVRTMPSTMTKLRETAQCLPPKVAVRKWYAEGKENLGRTGLSS